MPRRWLASLFSVAVSAFLAGSTWALSLYAVIPDNGTLDGALWLVDPVGGNQLIGRPVTVGLSGLAADSNGAVYASTFVAGGSSLIRIEPQDGSLLGSVPIVDPMGSPMFVKDLAMQPGTDVLFATTIHASFLESQKLYTIDVTTGVATLVGDSGIQSLGGGAIGFAPDGTLYYADFNAYTEDQWLYRLNPATGQQIGAPLAYSAGEGALAVGPDGMIYGSAALCCGGVIRKVDPSVGGFGVFYGSLGPTVGAIGDLAFVPEPSTALLLGAGLALFAAARRGSRG